MYKGKIKIVAKILVFNNDTDRMETYYRGEAEPMPYNTNGTLRVREFRGSSKSNILWTTKDVCKVGIAKDISTEVQYQWDLHSKDHMKEIMTKYIQLNTIKNIIENKSNLCFLIEFNRYW